ncbi:polyprotein [Salix suchowensis]|nr:polyprotein [Salix suchowensis]
MNAELEQHCRLEIQDLESKGLITKSRSPWSCAAFYVNKNSEIERGTPRLVINYKPLNSALKLKKNPEPWSDIHTQVVKTIKAQVQSIPLLHLADPSAPKIVETDASDIGFGNSHSWLFFFNTSIDTSSLPHWFQHWWDMFGCIPELLLEHPSVEEGFKLFKEAYRPIPSERHFKPITMFCAKFFLPWVCSWYYDYSSINGSTILIRRFRVKWWDAFRKEPQCSLKAVQDWFKNQNLPPAISQKYIYIYMV